MAARAGHRVSAFHFSESMVAELRRRIDRERIANVDVCGGDGMDLPYADGAFQGAFSMFGLMFFPDRGRGFRELHRVLARAARAVVSSWLPLDRVPVLAVALAALREIRPPPAGAPSFVPPLAQREECIAEMSAAGFGDVDVVELTHEETFVSTRVLWTRLERTSAPFALARVQLGDECRGLARHREQAREDARWRPASDAKACVSVDRCSLIRAEIQQRR